MAAHILVTGGAGFIGSHVGDELLRRGHRVRVLDNLSPMTHGRARKRPSYLSSDVELIIGDVRDPNVVARALVGIDAVFHFAALVGAAQSMLQADDYIDVNARGTGVLLQALAKNPVKKLIVGSSMCVYGEGSYVDENHQPVLAASRTFDQLRAAEWEPKGPKGEKLVAHATDEAKPITLESIYALTKYDQERLCLLIGRAYGIPTVALRLFNVYGPRQTLSNPYTGVLGVFAARLLQDRPPQVFEDGRQKRDFVSVHDVARACALALDAPAATNVVLNIGNGRGVSVLEVATAMSAALGKTITPEITAKYRVGDVRHCFADISLARQMLDYSPRIAFGAGIEELAETLRLQVPRDSQVQLGELRDSLPGRHEARF